jgi:hypothetical protein
LVAELRATSANFRQHLWPTVGDNYRSGAPRRLQSSSSIGWRNAA